MGGGGSEDSHSFVDSFGLRGIVEEVTIGAAGGAAVDAETSWSEI